MSFVCSTTRRCRQTIAAKRGINTRELDSILLLNLVWPIIQIGCRLEIAKILVAYGPCLLFLNGYQNLLGTLFMIL